jgi:hypothetical protein
MCRLSFVAGDPSKNSLVEPVGYEKMLVGGAGGAGKRNTSCVSQPIRCIYRNLGFGAPARG